MTYVTDTVDYQPYILVGLALILALCWKRAGSWHQKIQM